VLDDEVRKDVQLFGEKGTLYLVSLIPQQREFLDEYLTRKAMEFQHLGTVKQSEIIIDKEHWGSIDEWKSIHQNSLNSILN